MSLIQTQGLAAPRSATLQRLKPMIAARPWLYVLPAIITFVIWVYWPLGQAFYLSFFEWNMLPTAPKTNVGLTNYQNLISLPQLRQALGNTAIYMIGLLPMSVAMPLAIAIYTHDLPAHWRNFYRALIFVPLIVPPVVAAAVFRWLLDPEHGIVNVVIAALGGTPIAFLSNPDYAIWTLIFITGWKLIGFATLIFSAANANINPSLIEAARMDGASGWRIVRDVRLPLLSSTIFLLILMTILLGAQWSFTYINVLTLGGPLGTTTNIYYLLWEFGFSSLSVGWSSAAAVILFAGFTALACVLFWLMERFSFYDN